MHRKKRVCMKHVRFLLLYTLLYICGNVRAVQGDSLEVGLLTCEPGTEVYALYGHTGIRICNYATGEDWVFNYGMFSFRQPYFIWRFALGECDYQIGVESFSRFAREYAARGSSVYQQTLNLTAAEKRRLWALLLENMRPENREYRYNYFYDNCTTRARDRIEDAIEGEVVYPESDTVRSYREIVHQYTAHYPWAELGNDLCLGAEADRAITEREEMFAPFYMLRYADGAVIRDASGNERPLVSGKYKVVEGRGVMVSEGFPLSPGECAWGLFALVALLTLAERWRRACFWWLDLVLMTCVGVMGVVLTFLFFFSVHPTVGSNWQIWVFNPIPLVAMPWVVWCGFKRRKTRYHVFNAVVLMFFILFSALIPQDFCAVVVPLALVLLLRSCSYVASYRKSFDRKENAS